MLLASLYYLVGPEQQRGRYGEAQRFGGLEVDDQVELSRLLDGQLGRIGALQDLVAYVAARRRNSSVFALYVMRPPSSRYSGAQ